MDGSSGRWRQIIPSQFQWEAEALEYLRATLPDADPVRAWSNFEFAAGGTLNEVDAHSAAEINPGWVDRVTNAGAVTKHPLKRLASLPTDCWETREFVGVAESAD